MDSNNELNHQFNDLNKEQFEAVKNLNGPVLVLAGAGTGKTKTLVSRVINLINQGVSGSNILVLTFTNKAGLEMKTRVQSILGFENLPFLGTFHKFGQIFLRRYSEYIPNRKPNFVLLDTNEQKNILKECIRKVVKEEKLIKEINLYETINQINSIKNTKLENYDFLINSSDEVFGKTDFFPKIYKEYEFVLREKNLVDLDDLQFLVYKMLLNNLELRKLVQEQYKYLMVDEFQDTNRVQYEILMMMLDKEENLFVVGDDDQAIYSWRGANIENIANFPQNFPNAKNITLFRNYRSTAEILEKSNQLISFNSERFPKELLSVKGNSDKKIIYKRLDDDTSEANFVAQEIKKLINSGISPSDIAILYRINALSMQLENSLFASGVKFKIKGKTSLYERVEIKDILNHLAVVSNFSDDFSFEKVLKSVSGIGKQTIEKIISSAHSNKITIFQFLKSVELDELNKIVSSKKKAEALKNISTIVENLSKKLLLKEKNQRKEFIIEFEKSFNFKIKYSKHTKNNKIGDKIESINNFYKILERSIEHNKPLLDFIQEYILDAIESEDEKNGESKVTLMSIHLSKGLEFNNVFVIGLEEGTAPVLYPSDVNIEEERRLVYVAMTRAKEQLYLTSSNARFYHGFFKRNLSPSRFLSECGIIKNDNERLIKEILEKHTEITVNISQENSVKKHIRKSPKKPEDADFDKIFSEIDNKNKFDKQKKIRQKSEKIKKGDLIKHNKFGVGKVLEVKKDGNTILKIRFTESNLVKDIVSNFVSKIY